MAPAQALSGVSDEGKPDVSVKYENRESVDAKDVSGILCVNKGEDSLLCVGTSSAPTKADFNSHEGKLDVVVKSEKRDLVDAKDVSGLMCSNNREDSVFHVGSSTALTKVNEVMNEEIDIIDCTASTVVKTVKDEDQDATEYSSSFGDTFSGSDSELKQDHGDMEIESPFFPSNEDPAAIDGFNRVFKKKKVSAHWRKFISPLMWRCQWLELRMKELLSQASKYDKELAAYKHEKELQSKMIELDSSVSRAVPLTSQTHWRGAMKRRKRKRNEDKVDLSSYMSNHVVFSYYENKRTDTDGHSVDDDCGDLAEDNIRGNDDNDWLLGLKGCDSSLEQILLNIEAVQSRVTKLKTLLNNCICRNAREISSGNLFLGDVPAGYAQNVSDSPRNNTDSMPAGLLGSPPHRVSEYEMEDMVMPESAASSYGDAADLDIIESTVGGLLSADASLDQDRIRDLCRDSADDILIDNQVAENDYQNFKKVSHATEELQEMIKTQAETHSGDESTAPKDSMPEPGPATENVDMPQQPVLKPCYTGKKRGRKPKKKRRGGSVAGSGPPRSEKLHVSGPSKSEKLHGSGPSKSERPQGSGPSRSERLQITVPLRSERLKKRRLSSKNT
ncbi:uncharacterized protein LOC135632979 isoform X1 [Musa acuminata AAA Group]|uniref:uncharacterized protein LOC135632979 isoform X1 n=1 Tax=Musa acuminata AAA Group TaxID=214697 RepID=UPI0031DB2C6B